MDGLCFKNTPAAHPYSNAVAACEAMHVRSYPARFTSSAQFDTVYSNVGMYNGSWAAYSRDVNGGER